MRPARRLRPALRSSLRLLLACAAWGCSSGGTSAPPPAPATRAQLAPVVARDAVLFAPATVPAALAERLASARVVLLGEVHYMQEHQDFLAVLVAALQQAGFRRVLQEEQHAVAWTGEEYVMLRSDELPPDAAAFDRTLLEALRSLNAQLPEAERMHFGGFDINHSAEVFPQYARIFQERFSHVTELDPLLQATPGSAEYASALRALPSALAANAAAISTAIGADRYAQLADLVDVEWHSLAVRAAADHFASRELVLRDNVVKALSEAGTSGVAVNCGMFHAAKVRDPSAGWEPFGAWLAAHPEAYGGDASALRSVAFLPARGELLDGWNDPAPYAFDVTTDAPPDDLVRVLAERAGAQDAWLPLGDPLFRDAPVELDVGGTVVLVQPASALYDGFVLYHQVSVLASLALVR
jgi:hypothetical protein